MRVRGGQLARTENRIDTSLYRSGNQPAPERMEERMSHCERMAGKLKRGAGEAGKPGKLGAGKLGKPGKPGKLARGSPAHRKLISRLVAATMRLKGKYPCRCGRCGYRWKSKRPANRTKFCSRCKSRCWNREVVKAGPTRKRYWLGRKRKLNSAKGTSAKGTLVYREKGRKGYLSVRQVAKRKRDREQKREKREKQGKQGKREKREKREKRLAGLRKIIPIE